MDLIGKFGGCFGLIYRFYQTAINGRDQMFGHMRASDCILARKHHKGNAINPQLTRHLDIIGDLPVKCWIGKAFRINLNAVFASNSGQFLIIADIAAIQKIGLEERVD